MEDDMMNRRRFITGLFLAPAAPAIIRASSLMAVRSLPYSVREAAALFGAPSVKIGLSFTKGMKAGELYRFIDGPRAQIIGPALARGTTFNNFRLTTAGQMVVP